MTKEEQLMVRPIDREKLAEHLTKLFPVKSNQRLRTEMSAIVCENVMTDNECCYWYLDKKLHNGIKQFVYTVPLGIVTKTETGESYSMSPSYYHDMSFDELEQFIKSEISLKEFMKGRFNYNPRITKNTKDFMHYVGLRVLEGINLINEPQ